MQKDPFIVIPRDAADRMAAIDGTSGTLVMTYLPSEELYVISRLQLTSGSRVPVTIPSDYQTLGWKGDEYAGQWFRRPSAHVNIAHLDLIRRPGSCVPLGTFKSWVPRVDDPGARAGLAITIDPEIPQEFRDAGVREYAGWIVSRDGVHAIDVEVEPGRLGLSQLSGKWPTDRLSKDVVMVVGVGSIGGAVADDLAAMGVGGTVLVDPDRFLWHNVMRHILGKPHVGRFKVDAMKDHLGARWPGHNVMPLIANVVESADLVRPLLGGVDLVVCAADGIAPRRVVSHLAKRAGRPAVLACVLDDGGIGEILRLRPGPRFGCLLCQRAALADAGGIDPEADQELAYGTGHVHKPMTAIPTDLRLVANLTAKVAVATLLEGKHGQPYGLSGEHAVICLRADHGRAAPFDLAGVGEVSWHDIVRPRPNCVTCSAA